MAFRFYGVAVGVNNPADVVIGTSTATTDIELKVLDTNLAAATISKRDYILRGLEAIKLAVLADAGM